MSDMRVRVFQRGGQFFTAAEDGEFWPTHKAPMRVNLDDPDAAQHAKAWFLAWVPPATRLAWVDPHKLIGNLDELLIRLRALPAVRQQGDERDYCQRVGLPVKASGHCDWRALPTFGGAPPEHRLLAWSWDPDRVLIGYGGCDLRIVSRANLETAGYDAAAAT